MIGFLSLILTTVATAATHPWCAGFFDGPTVSDSATQIHEWLNAHPYQAHLHDTKVLARLGVMQSIFDSFTLNRQPEIDEIADSLDEIIGRMEQTIRLDRNGRDISQISKAMIDRHSLLVLGMLDRFTVLFEQWKAASQTHQKIELHPLMESLETYERYFSIAQSVSNASGHVRFVNPVSRAFAMRDGKHVLLLEQRPGQNQAPVITRDGNKRKLIKPQPSGVFEIPIGQDRFLNLAPADQKEIWLRLDGNTLASSDYWAWMRSIGSIQYTAIEESDVQSINLNEWTMRPYLSNSAIRTSGLPGGHDPYHLGFTFALYKDLVQIQSVNTAVMTIEILPNHPIDLKLGEIFYTFSGKNMPPKNILMDANMNPAASFRFSSAAFAQVESNLVDLIASRRDQWIGQSKIDLLLDVQGTQEKAQMRLHFDRPIKATGPVPPLNTWYIRPPMSLLKTDRALLQAIRLRIKVGTDGSGDDDEI